MATETKAQPAIEYVGRAITLPAEPAPMALRDAIDWLEQVAREQETTTQFREQIDAFPWDMGLALWKAIGEIYGQHVSVRMTEMSVPIGVNQTLSVPWGSFRLPGLSETTFQTEMATNEQGQHVGVLKAVGPKKYAQAIRALAERTRQLVREQSIYRGKALRWANAETPPTFLDLSGVKPSELHFPAAVMETIETTLFTPLQFFQACADAGIPFKRGTALVGPYGCGKTLTINVAAIHAVKNGIMFLAVDDPSELPKAMLFARQYGPALVSVEDIDRATENRDETCDAIMEALDGIEAKSSNVAVVFTSNHVDKIHPAMRRPGRIDSFIEILPPDAETVEVLLRQYARGLVNGDDLSQVAAMLVGHIPAEIREVAELAKLSAIRNRGRVDYLTAADLAVAARYVLQRDALFNTGNGSGDALALQQMAAFGGKLVQGIVAAADLEPVRQGLIGRRDVYQDSDFYTLGTARVAVSTRQ